MLVLCGILVANFWVHGILKPKQGFTDSLASANHGPQYSNWYCSNNGTNRSLDEGKSNTRKNEHRRTCLAPGTFENLHGYCKNGLGCRAEISPHARVRRLYTFPDVDRLFGIPADRICGLFVRSRIMKARINGTFGWMWDCFSEDGLVEFTSQYVLGLF